MYHPPKVRITEIRTIRLGAHPNLLWVEVDTADGLTGLGETFYLPGAVESVIHDFVAPMVLGRSALDRQRHWELLFSAANFFGHAGAEMRAISAMDIALWDLAGQSAGMPLYDMAGGRCRESIRVYNTCVDTPRYADQEGFLERPGELAEALLEAGITQMKIWPWDRFAPQEPALPDVGPAGSTAVGRPGHDLSAADLARGLRTVQDIRQAVGDRMAIAIEGHARWDLHNAIRIAVALEPYDVAWMEDMIQPTGVGALERLARETKVPQCVSERLITRFMFQEVINAGSARIVMPDLVWTGGLTEGFRIGELAGLQQLPVAPHDCTGPVNLVTCLHLCMTLPNAMVMEVVRGFCDGFYLDLVDRPVEIRAGQAAPPDAPGLGVRLRPGVINRPDATVRTSRLGNKKEESAHAKT